MRIIQTHKRLWKKRMASYRLSSDVGDKLHDGEVEGSCGFFRGCEHRPRCKNCRWPGVGPWWRWRSANRWGWTSVRVQPWWQWRWYANPESLGSDGTGQCPQDAICHSMGRRELPGRSKSISGSYFWKSTKEVYFNKNSSLCVGVYALPCTVEWGRRGVARPGRSKSIRGSTSRPNPSPTHLCPMDLLPKALGQNVSFGDAPTKTSKYLIWL